MAIMINTKPPPASQAYQEAVAAPAPKARHPWSHPAVYLAGRETGWTVLDGESDWAWRAFRRFYRVWCARAAQGEDIKALCLEARDGRPTWIQSRERQRRAHAQWMPSVREQLTVEQETRRKPTAGAAPRRGTAKVGETPQECKETTQRPERSHKGNQYLRDLHALFDEAG